MTENAYRAKCYLEEIIKIDRLMLTNILEQEVVFNRAQGCGSITIGDKVQTSAKGDVMQRAVADLTELQDEYEELFSQWYEHKVYTKKIINKMPDIRHRQVIMFKYFMRASEYTIAEHIHYSRPRVQQLHYEALEEFGRLMKDYPN